MRDVWRRFRCWVGRHDWDAVVADYPVVVWEHVGVVRIWCEHCGVVDSDHVVIL